MMALYNDKYLLYLETDVLYRSKTKSSNNAAQQPITLASKSLTSVQTHYNNLEGKRRALCILHGCEKISPLLLFPLGQHDDCPQTIGGNIQERFCKPITQPEKNSNMDT